MNRLDHQHMIAMRADAERIQPKRLDFVKDPDPQDASYEERNQATKYALIDHILQQEDGYALLMTTQEEYSMYTNKFGTTHINEALNVVSLDTRITKAFAKEGVTPSSALRRKVRHTLTTHPMLTATQAVGYVLHTMEMNA